VLPFIVANLWAIMHALAGAPYARMVDGMEQTAAAIIRRRRPALDYADGRADRHHGSVGHYQKGGPTEEQVGAEADHAIRESHAG